MNAKRQFTYLQNAPAKTFCLWFNLIFIFALSTLNIQSLSAQSIHNDTLREVLIKDKNIENITKTQTIDSVILNQYQHTSLQNLLQLHSNAFIKNYGIGSLSTISIRGSSAAQTAVLWHGMNINNAMTGISDFSILPVSFFDKITVNYGGNSANALAGHIELSDEMPSFKNQSEINIGAGYESLQNTAISASLLKSNSKYSIGIKGFFQKSQNEFAYYNNQKETFEELTHAGSVSKGIIADLYVKLRPQQTFALHVWAQKTARDIPPALFEDTSTKTEINSTLKAIATYDAHFNKWSSHTSFGVMHDHLNYSDSMISFSSNAEAVTLPFTETIRLFPSSRQKVSIIAAGVYSKLLTGKQQDIQRASVALHYDIEPRWRKLYIRSFVRKEMTNVFSLPLIAGLTIKRKLFKEYFIVGSLSSNYRMPTLNELYFIPGGNEKLLPETSKNLEGGIESILLKNKHSLKTNATIFTRDVKNWIVWYGGSILTPHNIQKVWSRGLEVDVSYRCKLAVESCKPAQHLQEVKIMNNGPETRSSRPSTFNLQLLYSYTLSTTKESAIANDYSIGKQIPYVPRYQLKMNIGFTKNAFDISYVYAYTGYRFVTTDESEYLLPYNTHNIFTSYTLNANSKHQLLTTFKINNILNKSYESIIGRIMPGRSFAVGLNYKFRN